MWEIDASDQYTWNYRSWALTGQNDTMCKVQQDRRVFEGLIVLVCPLIDMARSATHRLGSVGVSRLVRHWPLGYIHVWPLRLQL